MLPHKGVDLSCVRGVVVAVSPTLPRSDLYVCHVCAYSYMHARMHEFILVMYSIAVFPASLFWCGEICQHMHA